MSRDLVDIEVPPLFLFFALQIDGRDLWTHLSRGAAFPSDVAGINFNFAAGPGFLSRTTKTEYNDDGSYVEAIIATYEGTEFKLCRNCGGFYAVSLVSHNFTYRLFGSPVESQTRDRLPME